MKWALDRLRLIVAAIAVATSATLQARGDYLTFDIASHEAMADSIRFESRSWAEGAEGEGGRLAANTTWSGGEHVILNDLYIPSGVTLTINAGTVVRFREGTCIKVEDGGSIVLNGELGNEIVLEGYEDDTPFKGIVLQSGSAGYSDNNYVIVRGIAFGKFATVSINDTEAFMGGGQALVPVNVSGSRDTAFSFDWVAETNGVQFASGTMNWNRVSDGSKNITVPYPDGLPGCSNFTVRAMMLRCCTASKGTCKVNLSEFITTSIYTHEAMADYIPFESRDWAEGLEGDGGRLSSNVVWSGTHKIVSDVYIPSGVTLTLSADTVVEFCEGTRIKIEDGGKLDIVGVEGHDVIFRAAEGVTNFVGIVKMSNGTFADNSYVQAIEFTYGAFAGVALHDSSTFRSSGLALIPVTVSGSRSTTFSIDWVAETNGAPYKTGTMKWSGVSEGMKNITINYGTELDGYTNFAVRVAVDRACHSSPSVCMVKISDFIVSDIATHEVMADYIAFESREWAAGLEGEGGRLDGSVTWSGTHMIVSDVYIPSDVTLTLSADTIVEFCEGTRIKIEDGGVLNIVGAEGHDVIFRASEGVTNFVGVVKMSSGTYTDNMYVQYLDKPYSAYPYVTVHEATTARDKGKLYVPVSISGTTRNQSFNIDWRTDKGDAGTVTWASSSDGTKCIEIPIDAAPVGGTTNHLITVTAARGCNVFVGEATLTILEPDYLVKGAVAMNESDEDSGEFAVNGDIKTQPLFLNPIETVQYSGKWQTYDADAAAVLRVTLETDNGKETLKEISPSETGAFDLDLTRYPVGCYTLKHDILDEFGETLATMQKTFSIADDEDVEMHGGTLTQNETWKAGKVHVVYQTVVVPSIYTIFIEPGAIVKFMTGTGIDISQGGAFFANGIVFTHINDDTVGGDTLSDGFTVAPPMDAYFLSGNFTFGDDTELRGITQSSALTGTISTQKMLSRGSTYRVSGTVTISSGASLTIPPGTVLKMEDKAAIVVNSGATLNAIGTRAAPIIITSVRDDSYSGDTNGDGGATIPQPGDWEEIRNSGGTMNLAHVKAFYGGYGQYSNQGDAIIRTTGGDTAMECCEVKHSNLRLVGRTGGTVYAENCILADGRWGIDGAVTFVNGVIAECNIGANGAALRNSILWACGTYSSGCTVSNSVAYGETTAVQVGMIYADPLFVDPANGDFRILEGSPCVDAADSAVAPELDFYGQPRITLGGSPSSATETNGVVLVGQLADIGICEVMPRDVVSDIDLVPQSVRTTTNAVPGQLLFVKWEIANVGGREVDAAWRDTVSLVSESGREVELGEKITSSRIAIGGSVFCSGYFTVPAISEGTWYPKVNVNSYHDIFEGSLAANNALVGERGVIVGLEALDPNISLEGVINAGTPTVLKFAFGVDNANRMVAFDVSSGVTVTWGFGFMPQGASRSGAATASGDGVMFRVPEDATEVYVVLESDITTTYNLFTESTQMVITGVTPATLPSSGTTTLTISGAGFGDTNEVIFSAATANYQVQSVAQDAFGNLIATIDCGALIAGRTYDVKVSSGENEATLEGAVVVTKAEGKGILDLEYSIPSSVRPGRVFTFTVTYRNIGNKDMCCPLLTVQDTGSDANNPIQFSLDGGRFISGGMQFVGTDVNGGFDALHPGDEVTLLVQAKIPPANNGSTAISVRANTESDIMAKYTTEIDRYLPPRMKAEVASTTDEELKARGERMQQVFGANNGEMVQNFAALAKRFVECNGYALQAVGELVTYGVAVVEAAEETLGDHNMNVAQSNSSVNRLMLSSVDDLTTGAYLYPDMTSLNQHSVDLSDGDVAIIAHGLNDGLWKSGWMRGLASSLQQTMKFAHIVCIDWSGEANAVIPINASKHIGEIAGLVAPSLKASKINPSHTTLIGHSFGAHLLGYMAQEYFGDRVFKRHIGLDTAARAQVPDKYIVSGSCALQTEYYRTSSGSGRNDAYADRNYIVASKNTFNIVIPSAPFEAFLADHSYAHQWFRLNVITGKGSDVGFWMADTDKGGKNLSTSGFIGVIYGPDNILECNYPYVNACAQNLIHYPGNRSGWLDMSRAWGNTYDLKLQGAQSVENAQFKTGIPRRLNVDVQDVCDIQTISRMSPFYGVTVSVSDLDGSNVREIETLPCQLGTHFDFEITLPHDCINVSSQEKQIRFNVFGEDILGNRVHELYDGDNTAAYKINVLKGIGPEAAINNHRQNNFVIDCPQHFASYEEYAKSYNNGETFVYTYDGKGSKAMDGSKLVKFAWYDGDASNPNSDAQVFQRMYYKVSRGDYTISLVVTDDAGRTSSVKGILKVYPVIGKGQPIEQPRSYDPNEMRGKLGKGNPRTERFVMPGDELTYTIYFENMTNATAAAQEVFVTNSLSQYLDWSTFRMGEVSFGGQLDLGLVDRQNGTSEAEMEGTNFLVRTQLSLDREKGEAVWYLRIVDPTTATGWPEDIVTGFLPPNDPETQCGEGHLTYHINVREDAPANLVISNSADIVFDHNPVIKTDPAWWNTVAPDVGEVRFAEAEVVTDEGSNAVVRVKGGDMYKASSVKVYLTYNTAGAADVDVAKATVDDVGAKKFAFPVTLKWAAGEIGEKVIVIPVKADALVEGEEFLTLQLAGAVGQELGAERVCTVRISDAQWPEGMSDEEMAAATSAALPAGATVTTNEAGVVTGYFTKKDKKGNVAAVAMPGYVFVGWTHANGKTYSTKATIADKLRKSKKVTPKFAAAHYLRGLADPPNGGKVTGGGRYAEGKSVTLKATPTKYWSFEGWYEITEDVGDEAAGSGWRLLSKSRSLKVAVTNDAMYIAAFKPYPKVTLAVDNKSGGAVKGAGSYLAGKTVTLKATPKKGYAFTGWWDGTNLISLAASYKYKVTADGAALTARFKKESALAKPVLTWGGDTNLTMGVNYAAKLSVVGESAVSITKVTGLPKGLKYKGGKVSGVPTKAGTFTAAVTVALGSNRKKTWAYKMKLIVSKLPGFAQGTFNGWTYAPVEGGELGIEDAVRKVTISVTSAGKITASVGSLKFSGNGWNAGERIGYYTATLTKVRTVGSGKKAKKYKDVLKLTIDPCKSWTSDQLTGTVTTCLTTAPDLPINADTVVSARRNPFGDKDNPDAKALAAELAAQGTRDFVDGDGLAWKMKVSAAGVATISRMTGTGKKAKTSSATAVIEATPVTDGEGTGYTAIARFLVGGKAIVATWPF